MYPMLPRILHSCMGSGTPRLILLAIAEGLMSAKLTVFGVYVDVAWQIGLLLIDNKTSPFFLDCQ
jgi:hypothetical protein